MKLWCGTGRQHTIRACARLTRAFSRRARLGEIVPDRSSPDYSEVYSPVNTIVEQSLNMKIAKNYPRTDHA